jgi:hypothetical protein
MANFTPYLPPENNQPQPPIAPPTPQQLAEWKAAQDASVRAAVLPPSVSNRKIDLSAQPDDFSLQPAQSSVLGDWWKGSGVVGNYNKYANHSDAAVGDPGSPKAPLPQPPAGYVAGQAPYDPRYTAPTPQIQSQADYQSKLPPGMMDKPSDPAIVAAMLKQGANGPRTAQGAYTDALLQEARALPEPLTKVQKETARLSDLGFSKLMTPGVSSDGPLPNKTMVKADAPIKGSDLPKDLQAAYAQRGIEIDPNALYEKMSYGNVEGKGSAVGYRKFDPNRQQGTFSVTPGLSDAERQQVAQIDANQARQAAYGVSRKTGELYDAAQQHQQQQAALSALKQLQMQQEQGQFKATYDQKQAEIAQQGQHNKETMDWRAAQLNKGIMDSQAKAAQVNPKFIPTPATIINSARKSSIDGLTKLSDNDVLMKSMGQYGAPLDDPNSMYFTSSKQPGVVFFRDPRQKGQVSQQTIPIDLYLKAWAQKMYQGLGGISDQTEAVSEDQ